MHGGPEASIIVLAYGPEPTLERCLSAVLASTGISLEVVLVDNGYTGGDLDAIARDPRVRTVRLSRNTGFAGGCNLGAENARGDVYVLLNSDAFVEPDAVRRLVRAARDPAVGIASASLRLDQAPDRLNSCGNPVHYTGMTWSGGFEEPAAQHPVQRVVPSATGAALAIRAGVWKALGGFDDAYFAYLEDTDLSIRTHHIGLSVEYVPTAVVRHAYEFSRTPSKMYLLERNRLILVLTMYEARTLLLLAPALFAFELVMLLQAITSRGAIAKLRGWWWIATHLSHVRSRRLLVQGARTRADRELLHLFCSRIEPANIATPPGMGLLNAALGAYWRIARRWI